MVITFPHMGKAYIPIKSLFYELGAEIVVPPPITKKTLEIGTKLSPEMACLPLKINMGNYVESIEKGADTIVLSGSCGPCRFGYYGVVQREILHDLGYKVDMIILDPAQGDYKSFFQRIRRITNGSSWGKTLRVFLKTSKIIASMDNFINLSLYKRPREVEKGSTDLILQRFENEARDINKGSQILELIKSYEREMSQVKEREAFVPLRIGIIGEIYTVIEPYVNMEVEKKLGEMGVEVYSGITVNSWVKEHLSFDMNYKKEQRRILSKAAPFLNICVGGHAWQTIANAVHFADEGLDGVIQILPFGCMPEIVAESILPRVSEEKGIPIMTLAVDEMTGEAGFCTRLEAFTDLLAQRREMI